MKYILRVVIHEDRWESQLQDIIMLCRYADIEEIFVKEQCHQILMSCFPLEVHRRMAKIYNKMRIELNQHGIKFSINIATIVGHCDARLSEDMTLPYTKFVDSTLMPNESTYCIMDQGWQAYAKEVVRIYAKTNPEIIMIDDDFRSINHSGYLGCFCPLHVAETERECGVALTKETLKKHVLGNTQLDRKIREAWRKVNFRAQLQAAEKIEEGIHEVNGKIRIGLMNSGEPNHSVQGRDIAQLLKKFAGDKKPISRPLGGAYGDCVHGELIQIHHGMALSMAQLNDVEIISEVENWPHSLYTKSLKITELQMKLHTLAGADKISMNLFDFMGSPYSQEEKMMQLIRDSKNKLKLISQLRKNKHCSGVGMLWHKDCSLTQTNYDNTPENIIPYREQDSIFTLLGIPVAFEEQEVNFLTGSVAELLTDEKISTLLSRGIILDGSAFKVLESRGFGRYIGGESVGELKQISSERMIGEAFHGIYAENLLPSNWLRLGLKNMEIPLIKPVDEAKIISVYLDVEYRSISSAIYLYENELKGRVCVLPSHIGTWTFAYRSRANMLRNIVSYLYNDAMPFILKKGINIAPFYYKDQDEIEDTLVLVNTGLDEEEIEIVTTFVLTDEDGNGMECEFTLAPLEFKLLLLKR